MLILCVFDANACVISPEYLPASGSASTNLAEAAGSVDVLINMQRVSNSNYPRIPEHGVQFNTCEAEDDYFEYRLMVHEAGHALGLSGFSLQSLVDSYSTYKRSHPTIPDAVMSEDSRTQVEEPDCSPHPFDILAVYALYQKVAP